MIHTTTDEEMTSQAALYAVGALDDVEARDFEQHVAACAACAAELSEFRCVAEGLALAAPPAPPPADVRSRLLKLVSEDEGRGARNDSQPRPASAEREAQTNEGAGFIVVRAGEGEWCETKDRGISYKLLFVDRERSTFTTLVRMEPGARIPAHRHLGLEQCLVLEGDLRSGSVGMSAGDFNCSLPGSVHDELTTEGGALLLIVSPEKYEVVAPRRDSAS